MKKVVLNYLVIAALIISAAFTSCGSMNTIQKFLENPLVGVWEGSYLANSGENGLTLNVYKDGANYKATFDFYNLPGKTNTREGKYLMNVTYDEAAKRYFLKGYEWIARPASNYVFVDLDGTINGNVFSGNVRGSGAGANATFRLVKK